MTKHTSVRDDNDDGGVVDVGFSFCAAAANPTFIDISFCRTGMKVTSSGFPPRKIW